MQETLKITALVVTYNRKELLTESLKAIQDQTFPVEKILVINNHSDDGTELLFQKGAIFDDPKIELYTTDKNLGGSGGFAKGFEIADARDFDYLWIMDDDAIAYPDTLEKLIASVSDLKGNRFGFLASAVYGPNDEPMNVPVLDKRTAENGYEDWYRYGQYGMIKVRSATFVSLLISHDAIRKLGYPIKEYFIWGDDTEYTTRLSRYYAPSYLCAASRILHKRENAKRLTIFTENNKNRVRMYYYLYRNSLLTARKYNPKGNSALHVCEFHLIALRCLFAPNIQYRFLKFITMEKAIFSYLFGSSSIKKILKELPHE